MDLGKKVVWLTDNYFPERGGMAVSCDRITRNLASVGLDLLVVYFSKRHVALAYHPFRVPRLLEVPLGDLPAHQIRFAWTFLEEQCGVVASSSQDSYVVAFGGATPIFVGPIFAAWMKAQLITVLRGNDFDLGLLTPGRSEILVQTLSKSDRVITVSSDKLEKIEGLVSGSQVDWIPNGICVEDWEPLPSNLSHASRVRAELPDDLIVVGLFGELKRKKGIDFFVNCLCKRQVQNRFHLLFVGSLEDELASFMSQSGVSYTLIPAQDRQLLLGLYPVCDLVAIPSFYDGLPNVLLEAGALGIPVLVSSAGGMGGIVGHHGFVFGAGNEEDCIRAIDAFLSSAPEDRRTRADRFKEVVRRNFSDEQETQKYLKLFSCGSR